MFAVWLGEEKLIAKLLSWCCDGISADLRGAGLSNKFSSAPEGNPACKLLLLGFGVPLLVESKPELVSRRLSGLGCEALKQLAPGALALICCERENSNLMGLSSMPKCWLSDASQKSMLLLRAGVFSSPKSGRETMGVEFPTPVESASARRGLFGARLRGDDLKGPARRRLNFFFVVGAACDAKGDSECAAMGLGGFCTFGLKARASASGESGEPGVSVLLVRSWKREGLEGERDKERRSCWIEEKCAPSMR